MNPNRTVSGSVNWGNSIMTFMKVKALVISVLILTGCATADIVPIGRDT